MVRVDYAVARGRGRVPFGCDLFVILPAGPALAARFSAARGSCSACCWAGVAAVREAWFF
eukprot:6012372-Alexandrium_andersonii.AAC.1